MSLFACNKEKAPAQAELLPPPEIPVEDLFKNSEKRTFRLSPDGSHLSYMAPYKTRMNIHFKGIDAQRR